MEFLSPECRSVTNYIIAEISKYNKGKMVREQIIINANKIQKLLYFCEIEYMKKHNGKTLFEEDFYAWSGGPVIPNIYENYCLLSSDDMIHTIKDIKLSEEIINIINKVLEQTKDMDTLDLAEIIRVKNGPWKNNYRAADLDHNQIIPKNEIYEFYLNEDLFSVEKKDIPKIKKLTKNNKVY